MRIGRDDMRVTGRWAVRGIVAGVIGLMAVLASPVQAQRTVAATTHTDSEAPGNNVFAREVTLRLDNVPLKSAIKALAAESGVRIQYRTKHVESQTRPIDIQAVQQPLGIVLQDMLAGTGLIPNGISEDLIVLTRPEAENETGSITGTVIDSATKAPLRDVVILINDSATKAVTKTDGSFRLTGVPVGTHKVGVRLMGYARANRVISVESGKTLVMDFVIQRSTHALDQVVVTGTVAATEMREVPNAITVVTAKQLEERNITHIDQLFRGDIPGLFVVNTGTAPKIGAINKRDAVTMFTRGGSLLDGASPPIKTYIDGIEVSDPDYINQINPASIERIEIVSGPQASSIYGSGALGGVMQIFTKKGSLGRNRPEISATIKMGMLENNFSTSRAPRHDHTLSVSDGAGAYSYNLGGGYYYDGQWTPGRYAQTFSGFGGIQRTNDRITSSVSLRYSYRQLGSDGGSAQVSTDAFEQGLVRADNNVTYLIPSFGTLYKINTYMAGANLTYRATRNWSNSFVAGVDRTMNGNVTDGARYLTPSDSLAVSYRNSENTRTTLSYNTSSYFQIGSWIGLNMTAGADLTQNKSYERDGQGDDSNIIRTTRYGWVNQTFAKRQTSGYFTQLRFGLFNKIHFSFGMRGEFSPEYGTNRKHDITPTNGFTYTEDFGDMTAKFRFAYGRSTRAPGIGAKDSILECVRAGQAYCESNVKVYWTADLLHQLAAPDLRPESQAGPEGGVDLYLGNRGSLSITYYNQMVKDLISRPLIGRVVGRVEQYGRLPESQQFQYQNLGDMKNVGMTGTGTLNAGPMAFSGSYSWTRSRVVKLHPLYTGDRVLGGSLPGMAEHTGALTTTYSNRMTSVGMTVNWIGQILQDRWVDKNRTGDLPRLYVEQTRRNLTYPLKDFALAPKAEFTINASRVISQKATMILNIMNATNKYGNEGTSGQALSPTLGRQTFIGMRVRL